MVARLAAEGIDVSAHRPRRVEARDLSAASRVVSMGCDVSELGSPGTPVERWDEVPAPSVDLNRAFERIAQRVSALVEEEAGREASERQ